MCGIVGYIGKVLFPCRKIFFGRNKRQRTLNGVCFAQRKAEQGAKSDSAGKRLAYAFHHLELLRTAHKKLSFFMRAVEQ